MGRAVLVRPKGAKERQIMSDRGVLFLFSVLMILAGVGAAVWLVVTGQAATVDGLFLVLTALLVALCFALYVLYMIHRAIEAVAKTAPPGAETGAPAPAAKPPAPPAAPQQPQEPA